MTLSTMNSGYSDLIVVSTSRQEYPDGIKVYNLQVKDDHTYFVAGENGDAVWVHNADKYMAHLRSLGRDALGKLYPGKMFGSTGYITHAHHIIFRKGLGAAGKKAAANVNKKLSALGFDTELGRQNLVYAPNWGHSDTVPIAMEKAMKKLIEAGQWNEATATKMLQKFARDFIRGKRRP